MLVVGRDEGAVAAVCGDYHNGSIFEETDEEYKPGDIMANKPMPEPLHRQK